MSFKSWIRSLKSRLSPTGRGTPRRGPSGAPRPRVLPRLEVLEDRCTPSAGALDPTFGAGAGYATTSLSTQNDVASAALIQPWDGKIVVAGHTQTSSGAVMSLVRYNADGSLDGAFGSGGKVVSKVGDVGVDAAALYPQSGTANDGKIIEASGSLVARFNANGTLDATFGNRGVATVSWSGAIAVVIQPDGKVVVDGAKGSSAFELTRFNANGTLDASFGTGGTASLSSSSPVHASALGLQADGKLVVAGWVGYMHPGLSWELARFNANGTLDTTFDSAGAVPGTVTTHFAAGSSVLNGLAIYPSTGTDTADYGKIMAVGGIVGNPAVALARYNADGTADITFGQSGQVTTPGAGSAFATAIQADGKIVVVGATLQRYNTNGALDATFGNGGNVTPPPGSSVRAVAIQADGRIVAAGSTPGGAGSDFLVARYLSSEPEIGSFTASANPVTGGSSLTLTASNLTDGNPSSTITQVAFYVQLNGANTLLGYGTQTSPGVWTYSFTVNLAPGSYTLFAQAEDSDGVFGDPLALNLQVN